MCIRKDFLFQPHRTCNGKRARLGCGAQTKDNKIGICCFSAKHAAIRRKSNQTSITTRKHKYS